MHDSLEKKLQTYIASFRLLKPPTGISSLNLSEKMQELQKRRSDLDQKKLALRTEAFLHVQNNVANAKPDLTWLKNHARECQELILIGFKTIKDTHDHIYENK
jgi:hypothetical protein